MHRYFFIIAFLSFGKSVSAQTVKADTGTIEVIVKPIKDSLGKETSFIKIEIYRTYNNKNEKLGLMTVVINGVFFLTELDGSFEKYLKNRKVYDFEFMICTCPRSLISPA